jgi:hypothetical protein
MEEVRIEGVFALEEKLAVQKQIKVLESQRDAKRRSPFVFEEITGAAVVTFRVNVAGAAQVTPQVTAVLHAAARLPRSRDELQTSAGIKDREHFRKAYLEPLLSAGWLERTIPDKPRSRLQRYRTTAAGERALSQAVKK